MEEFMAKRARKQYTEAERKNILAAATQGNMTATDVQKKFGVRPVTYYSWRKKSGAAGRRRGRPAGATRGGGGGGGGGDLVSVVRGQVQVRVRSMLPDIVRSEVNSYLDSLLGGGGGRRRGRRPGRPRKKK
jgi:transposase-like protein